MSTLSEIEAAIERLPASQLDQLALWIEQHRARKPATSAPEPDFVGLGKGDLGSNACGRTIERAGIAGARLASGLSRYRLPGETLLS